MRILVAFVTNMRYAWSIKKDGVPNLRLQSKTFYLRVFSANGLFDLSDSQSKPISIIFYDTDNLDSSTWIESIQLAKTIHSQKRPDASHALTQIVGGLPFEQQTQIPRTAKWTEKWSRCQAI